MLEVSDNGRGISASEYAGVAKKSWTSKIVSFEDVYRVSSFGFRGEALSALCELSSSLEITTRTAVDAAATHLTYGHDGSIKTQRAAARPVGTTVSISGLFTPLPVRHREFIRALRKQYNSMIALLHAFAMISTGVRFNVTNMPTGSSKEAEKRYGSVSSAVTATLPPGPRAMWQAAEAPASASKSGTIQRVLSTSGGTKLRDHVAELFGADFLASLTDIDVELPCGGRSAAQLRASRGGAPDMSSHVEASDGDTVHDGEDGDALSVPQARVTGLVSKAGTGVGRSNNEKQFFYLNGRPVDLPRVMKALNECWRQYEMGHKPAAILNFALPHGTFDVNVSPDKREVLIIAEGALLDAFKAGLHAIWEPSRRTFTVLPAVQADISGMLVQSLPKARPLAQAAPPPPPPRSLSPTVVRPRRSVSPAATRIASSESSPTGIPAKLATKANIIEGRRDEEPVSAIRNQGAQEKDPRSDLIVGGTTPAVGHVDSQPVQASMSAVMSTGSNTSIASDGPSDTRRGHESGAEVAISLVDLTPDEDLLSPTVLVHASALQSSGAGRSSPEAPVSKGVTTSEDALGVDVDSVPVGASSGAMKRRRTPKASSSIAAPTHTPNSKVPIETLDIAWMRALYQSPLNNRGRFVARTGVSDGPITASSSLFSASVVASTQPVERTEPDRMTCPAGVHAPPTDSSNSATVDDGDAAPLIRDIAVVAAAVGATPVSLAACAEVASDAAAREELEREYTRVLNKPHFTAMSAAAACIGQYNKGFIISALGSDLFILDQRACARYM